MIGGVDVITVLFIFSACMVFYFAFLEGGYFYRGRHRGEYVEPTLVSSSVKPKPRYLLWTGNVSVAKPFSDSESPTIATLEIANSPGLATVPVLAHNEQEIREYINDEFCSTPIFTGLKYGRFGDSDFDRVDSSPLCLTVSTWLPGDNT